MSKKDCTIERGPKGQAFLPLAGFNAPLAGISVTGVPTQKVTTSARTYRVVFRSTLAPKEGHREPTGAVETQPSRKDLALVADLQGPPTHNLPGRAFPRRHQVPEWASPDLVEPQLNSELRGLEASTAFRCVFDPQDREDPTLRRDPVDH